MDPFWPTLGSLIFLPGVKKRFCKISLNLELKKGKKYLEGSVCRFVVHFPMFKGCYSKKTDYNKHKKVIWDDFDPFFSTLPPQNRHFRPFFQLSGAFLGSRDF